jgi:hypothetical protein
MMEPYEVPCPVPSRMIPQDSDDFIFEDEDALMTSSIAVHCPVSSRMIPQFSMKPTPVDTFPKLYRVRIYRLVGSPLGLALGCVEIIRMVGSAIAVPCPVPSCMIPQVYMEPTLMATSLFHFCNGMACAIHLLLSCRDMFHLSTTGWFSTTIRLNCKKDVSIS